MTRERVSWTNRLIYGCVGALIAFAIVLLCFIFVPQLSAGLVDNACTSEGCANDSAIAIAGQLGRLDVISLVMGILGIGVGAFAIFGFFAVKDHSEAVAESVAKKVAEQVAAERVDWWDTKRNAPVPWGVRSSGGPGLLDTLVADSEPDEVSDDADS